MEILRLGGPARGSLAVISVHPGIVGGVGAVIGSNDEAPCGSRFTGLIQHGNAQAAHRLRITPLCNLKLPLLPAKRVLNPKRSVAAAVRDKRNVLAIGRPAGR